MKTKVVILGSTGSIGENTLKVCHANSEMFEVLAITAHSNIEKFVNQITIFRPKFAVMENTELANEVMPQVPHNETQFIAGKDCFLKLANEIGDFDCLVSAITGMAGMNPTFTLLNKCRILAIANKESVVCAGHLLLLEAKKYGIKIEAIDSEHNSLARIMQGIDKNSIKKAIITASGGPFWGKSLQELKVVTPVEANAHPTWKMGSKINIDSATMVNKALELMEASVLFGFDAQSLDAVIHRKSIVHAIIETKDHGMTCFMSNPNMQIHIANAISGKMIMKTETNPIDLTKLPSIEFHEVPRETYPAFYLGKDVLAAGHAAQIVFNAANEFAVSKYLHGQIGFLDIPKLIGKTLDSNFCHKIVCVQDVLDLDRSVKDFCIKSI